MSGRAASDAFSKVWLGIRDMTSAAEDVVQDAFARLLRSPPGDIEDDRDWLIVVTSRLCLDQIRSARSRRERPHDASEIEFVPRAGAEDLADPADRVLPGTARCRLRSCGRRDDRHDAARGSRGGRALAAGDRRDGPGDPDAQPGRGPARRRHVRDPADVRQPVGLVAQRPGRGRLFYPAQRRGLPGGPPAGRRPHPGRGELVRAAFSPVERATFRLLGIRQFLLLQRTGSQAG